MYVGTRYDICARVKQYACAFGTMRVRARSGVRARGGVVYVLASRVCTSKGQCTCARRAGIHAQKG